MTAKYPPTSPQITFSNGFYTKTDANRTRNARKCNITQQVEGEITKS